MAVSRHEAIQGAGLALLACGAPGILYVRGALGDADEFAAEMARQVLDLPAATRFEESA